MGIAKLSIWFLMIRLALIQRNGKMEVFVFEVIVYILIKTMIKKIIKKDKKNGQLVKNSKKEEQKVKKYKYESDDNQLSENLDHLYDDEISPEYLKKMVEVSKNENNAKYERIMSYDFRQFRGRNDVTWEEVYEYLWNQCRYKGTFMWIEYIGVLIKEGILTKADKKKILNKAGSYIPWDARPDLESEENEFKRNSRVQDNWIKSNVIEPDLKQNKWWLEHGIINQKQYEYNISRWNFDSEKHMNYLKIFNYDDYLKKKGYIE